MAQNDAVVGAKNNLNFSRCLCGTAAQILHTNESAVCTDIYTLYVRQINLIDLLCANDFLSVRDALACLLARASAQFNICHTRVCENVSTIIVAVCP